MGQLSSAAGFGWPPAAVLSNTGPPVAQAFNGPLGIAFDASGNLWVLNNNASALVPSTIVAISAAQLGAAAGVTGVTASTVLNSTVVPGGLPTINNPWGIVFDISGNMWITNEQLSIGACSGSVVEFTKGAISGGGLLAPPADMGVNQTPVGGGAHPRDPHRIPADKKGKKQGATTARKLPAPD